MRMRLPAVAGVAAIALAAGAGGAAADDFGVVRQVSVGSQPGPVISAYVPGWVINRGDDTVTRIDATTGAMTTVSVGTGAVDIEAGFGAVRVLSGQGGSTATIRKLDSTTARVETSIRAALPIASGGIHEASIEAPEATPGRAPTGRS